MTPAEAAVLIGIAASFDNRKPDEAAATAWAMALDGLPFADCRDVIVAHYQRDSEWLMPSHVVTAVRRIRNKRIADAGDLCPPPNLSVAKEQEWLRLERKRIGDGEQPSPETRVLVSRGVVELPSLPAPPPVTRAAVVVEDALVRKQRRDEARAELAAMKPAPIPTAEPDIRGAGHTGYHLPPTETEGAAR